MKPGDRTWWLVIELDGIIKCSTDITVSARERLTNRDPKQLKQLLTVRFDQAARKLREDFLKLA